MSLSTLEKTGHELAYKHLLDEIDEQLWGRLVGRVVSHKEVDGDVELGERIVDQALAYVEQVSIDPQGGPYSPSGLVDIGWHEFLLFTREYATFCGKVGGGRFVHHSPCDPVNVVPGSAESNVARTVAAMKARGVAVDPQLWVDETIYCDGDEDTQPPPSL